jgi:hypothetical protein
VEARAWLAGAGRRGRRLGCSAPGAVECEARPTGSWRLDRRARTVSLAPRFGGNREGRREDREMGPGGARLQEREEGGGGGRKQWRRLAWEARGEGVVTTWALVGLRVRV